MAVYRAYVVGDDGHIIKSVDLDCIDDEVAKQEAQQLVERHVIELWDGTRRIARFEPPKLSS